MCTNEMQTEPRNRFGTVPLPIKMYSVCVYVCMYINRPERTYTRDKFEIESRISKDLNLCLLVSFKEVRLVCSEGLKWCFEGFFSPRNCL